MITIKIYLRKHVKDATSGIVWISFYVNREKVNFSTKVCVLKRKTGAKKSIYSEQHRRNFDIKDDILRVENDPDDESRLNLTINRKTIAHWFREQWHRLRYGTIQPQQEERKNRGFKL